MELLLLSNSRTANGWLVDHVPAIRAIAAGRTRAFFVPYAVLGAPWEEFSAKLFAGANLACPTIKTTNDMPIADPGGLEALGLVPFQINPHYTNAHPPGHQGETRDQRLAEFALVNPGLPVVGLPEGDWLRISGASVALCGPHPAVLFAGKTGPAPLQPGPLRLP